MPAQVEKYATQYFTGAQATIWVGEIFVDECFGIQYHATQSIVPLYGYASSRFDAVARGKVMVQGVFEINFIDEGYLYAILQEAKTRRQAIKEEPDNEVKVIARDPVTQIQEQIEVLKEVQAFRAAETSTVVDEATNIRNLSREQSLGEILNTLSNLDIAAADRLGRELAAGAEVPTENVIYKMIPFRLTGHFGHPELYGKKQGTFKEIKNCFLVSNEMIVGSNDEPAKERYSFIAQWHI
jgi:hypothetical protein